MKTHFLILISILLLTSCDEKIKDPDPIKKMPKFILKAGDVLSDSVSYHEFNPYITVKGLKNGVDTNFFYLDSFQLDANSDGVFDLHFEYYMYSIEHNCDTDEANDNIAIDCFPDADAFCKIKTLGSVEIAMDQTFFGLMPKRFNKGDSIDSNQNWLNLPIKTRFSIPTSEGFSDWDTDDDNCYMGFRIFDQGDTIYACIRLNTNYSSCINIFDYAIEK